MKVIIYNKNCLVANFHVIRGTFGIIHNFGEIKSFSNSIFPVIFEGTASGRKESEIVNKLPHYSKAWYSVLGHAMPCLDMILA